VLRPQRHGPERSRGAAQGRGPRRPAACCRRGVPGLCRGPPAQNRLRKSCRRDMRPRQRSSRPEVALRHRSDLRRRPLRRRCPPSHSLPRLRPSSGIRSAPNRPCRRGKHASERGGPAIDTRVVFREGSRAVSPWKTGSERTGPKPDIRDIIGRWGQGCARRLRADCWDYSPNTPGRQMSPRGDLSLQPRSAVRCSLGESSNARRASADPGFATRRCSSRSVASLVMGWVRANSSLWA